MNKKDHELFIKYLEKVKPIKKQNKIEKKIKKIPKNIVKKTSEKKVLENEKKDVSTKTLKSLYSIEFGRANKLLKKGSIKIDKKIDFHGKKLLEAEHLFSKIVVENYYNNKRCILLVTGKGLKNLDNESQTDSHKQTKLYYGKIREGVLHWVKKPELSKFILTIEKAGQKYGGDGAFFIYLRKNKN